MMIPALSAGPYPENARAMKALATLLFSIFPVLAGFAADRPHIVLVMADDQGWGDMAYNGHPVVKTPHFDKAAAEGLRFDRFYAAAPVCSPTRASVLTGRHPNRMGVFKWGYPLRPQELTVAEALKAAGYTTGHFGKWHLGSVRRGSNPSHPGRHGFDRWVSAPNFYDNDAILSDEGTAVRRQGESSAIAVNDALAWMKGALQENSPIFAAVWFGSPHVPHRAQDEDRALYAEQPEEARDFLGEITGMDRAFGELKAGLEDLGIRENTVLWYCSDNGALPRLGRTGGFRGRKGSVYEGGLLVPAILEWPAKLGAPRSTDVRCNTMDIYPTLLEIAGVTMPKQPPLDGNSLVDLIESPVAKRPRPMGFWDASVGGHGVSSAKLMAALLEAQKEGKDLPPEISHDPDKLPEPPHPIDRFPGHAAWIDGNWKLHRMEDDEQNVQWELYDLQADPEEAQNLFAAQSEVVSIMQPALLTWLQSVVTSLNGADYEAASAMFNVTKRDFGQTAEGETVSVFRLSNPQGWTAEIMTHGATLVTMEVPDKNGALANVNLRLDSWEDYAKGHPLLGSIVGRYANRIAGGKLVIDGTDYAFDDVGSNGVHIHGGSEGLQKQLWDGTAKTYPGEAATVIFKHVSSDGHGGYPGKLSVSVRYTLSENALILDYHATTDKPTHLNLTNHAYWNLGGAGSGDILDHELTLASTHFLEVDERKVPTGRLTPVAGGLMDFRKPRALEDTLNQVPGGGYDHCYVLNPETSGEPAFAAKVRDPDSGRVMEVLTTEPGVQLYTANYLSDQLSWQGKPYGRHHAICLETQHYPDTPNHAEFPSTLLRPGEFYRQRTIHRFSVEP